MSRQCRQPCFGRARGWSRRAFTLVESLAVVVVLSIAIPPAVSVMTDSAKTQAESIRQTRATWFATAVLETILADVNSDAAGLGFSALDDSNAYLTTAVTGLNARMNAIATQYATYGMTYSVSIGPLSDAGGKPNGDPDIDVFRTVTVAIQWTTLKGDAKTLNLGSVVTDL